MKRPLGTSTNIFDSAMGETSVCAYLTKALQEGKLSHALLFSGKTQGNCDLVAKKLAAFLLQTTLEKLTQGNAFDFHEVKAESKSSLHTIEKIRETIHEAQNAAFGSFGKVFLIHDADRMQAAAANALLKTLEEPPSGVTFILCTERPQELLDTIRSRCVILTFQDGKGEDLALEKEVFAWLGTRAPYHETSQLLERFDAGEGEDGKAKAEKIFALILLWARDQHARRIHAASTDLLFPQMELYQGALSSLETIEQRVQETKVGFQRNIKLSTCLQYIERGLYQA